MGKARKGTEESVKRILGLAEAPSLAKSKKNLPEFSLLRRTQETCVFCPDGLGVPPDLLIPGNSRFTCGQVLGAPPTLTGALCT